MNQLYFVALVPPDPILSEVRQFKLYCRDHFNSGHALRSPAHITLYPPFRANKETLEECSRALGETCWSTTPFEVRIDGFDCFKPRVIFAKPDLSVEMRELQKQVAYQFNDILKPLKIDSRPYHPHITIAFRDLTKANFYKAWEYFKGREYSRSWDAGDVCILLLGDAGWTVLRRLRFGSLEGREDFV